MRDDGPIYDVDSDTATYGMSSAQDMFILTPYWPEMHAIIIFTINRNGFHAPWHDKQGKHFSTASIAAFATKNFYHYLSARLTFSLFLAISHGHYDASLVPKMVLTP